MFAETINAGSGLLTVLVILLIICAIIWIVRR